MTLHCNHCNHTINVDCIDVNTQLEFNYCPCCGKSIAKEIENTIIIKHAVEDILYNAIETPDGTILESRFRHDYRTHTDDNGEVYMVDGGWDYLRRNKNIIPFKELSLTTSSPIEKIREHFTWGTYGKSGTEPLSYVLIKDMSTNHIEKCIEQKEMFDRRDRVYYVFKKELEYRKTI